MRDWPAGRGRSVLSLAPRICVLTAVLCAFSLALGAPPRAGADSPPYGSVTGATAHLSSLASGATGVTWVVRFRTSGAGALVAGYGTVTLIAPPGTVLPTSGILSDPGSSAGPAPAPAEAAVTAGGAIANFTVPSKVSSDTEVELSLSGVTNPPASGPQSLAVTTSSDIDPATVTFSLKGSGRNLGKVISPTVQLSSAAAGASQLNLEVTFTLPAGGSLAASTGEIFLVGPPGETFGDGGTIKDLTTGKSGGFNGVLGGVTVIGNGAVLAVSTTIPLNAGDRVLLTNSGAANPGDPGSKTLEIATSADLDWAVTGFTIVPASSVTNVVATSSSLSAGAVENTLSIGFQASATGAVVAGQGEITILAPPGTTFMGSGTVKDLTTGKSGGYFAPIGGVMVDGGGTVLSIVSPISFGPHARVEISNVGATNPGTAGHEVFQVDTSSDPLRGTGSLDVSPQTAVGSPSVKVSATPASQGGGTTYTFSFRTSPTGGLVAGQGQIELIGPPGTVFGSSPTVTDVTTGSSAGASGSSGPSLGPDGRWMTVTVPRNIAGGNQVTLTVPSSTATKAAWTGGMTIVTTSDTRPTVAPFRTSGSPPATAVTGAGASCSTSAAGASGATCLFRFVASSSGAMPARTGSVTIITPVGLNLSNSATITDLRTNAKSAVTSVAYRGIGPGDESVATFALPSAISAGDAVALSVENVTLPPVPGRQVISIDTTADIAPVSVAVLTRPPAAVTLGSSSESSDAPGATAVTYTETFVASANGALAAGNGSITLVAPPGTRFSANGTITDLTTHASAPGGVGSAGDNGAVISLVTRIPIRPGDRVELVMLQVTNPSAQVGQLAVSTSSDEALGSRPAPAAHANRWVSTIASSLRTPRESLTPLRSVPANVGLAGLIVLFLSFPSTLFNQTFSDNYAEIVAWWNRRTRRLRRSRFVRSTKERLARHDRGDEAKPRRAAEKRDFVVVFVAGAFLASLNDPTFLRGQASLVTLPAVALSMVVSLVVPALTARAYHVRRYHDAVWRLRALPAGLAIAAGCVVFSRLTNFEPGYLYGIVCGVLFTRKLGKRAQGHVAFLGLCAVLVVGVAAWFAWVPVRSEAMTNPGSIWLGFAEDVLAMVFVGGLVGAFFALLPLRGLAGFNIRRWNRRAWMAMYFVVFAVLVQVLLRPSTRAGAPATHAPLIGTVVAFFAAAALSVAFFEHFERKHRTPASQPQSFAEKVRAVVEASRARKDETTGDETEEGARAKADGAGATADPAPHPAEVGTSAASTSE